MCHNQDQMNTVANMDKESSLGNIIQAPICQFAWNWQPVTWGKSEKHLCVRSAVTKFAIKWPKFNIFQQIPVFSNFNRYFEFRLCPNLAAKQECLDKHLLELIGGTPSVPQPNDLNTRFYPRNGSRIYEIKARLPAGKNRKISYSTEKFEQIHFSTEKFQKFTYLKKKFGKIHIFNEKIRKIFPFPKKFSFRKRVQNNK